MLVWFREKLIYCKIIPPQHALLQYKSGWYMSKTPSWPVFGLQKCGIHPFGAQVPSGRSWVMKKKCASWERTEFTGPRDEVGLYCMCSIVIFMENKQSRSLSKSEHLSDRPFSSRAVKLKALWVEQPGNIHTQPQRRRGVRLINDPAASARSKSYSLFLSCLSCMHEGEKITSTLRTHNSGERVPSQITDNDVSL